MSGRSHLPPSAFPRSRVTDDPRLLLSSSATGSSRAHQAAILEDRISCQHREIQILLSDNQRLAATHVALKQELAASSKELRHFSAAAAKVKAERDAEVREVYEKSLKMDAEVRAIDAMRSELVQVLADVSKLSAVKQELMAELKAIEGDLAEARLRSQEVPLTMTEIESLRYEIQRGRAAVEFEKNTRNSNLKQRQAMEQSMTFMAREVERLQAELANADKKTMAEAATVNPTPSYAPSYGNPDIRYGGNLHSHPYSIHLGGADTDPQYASGAIVYGPYDVQQTQARR